MKIELQGDLKITQDGAGLSCSVMLPDGEPVLSVVSDCILVESNIVRDYIRINISNTAQIFMNISEAIAVQTALSQTISEYLAKSKQQILDDQ